MAVFQYRIDNLAAQGGKVFISYTMGSSPLPATWQDGGGKGQVTTKADLADSINQTEEMIKGDLLRNAILVLWKKADPTLSNPALVIGKVATIDFQNNGLSVTVA